MDAAAPHEDDGEEDEPESAEAEAEAEAEGADHAESEPRRRRPRRRRRGRGRRSDSGGTREDEDDRAPRDAADEDTGDPLPERAELPPAEGDAAEAALDCTVQLARLADLELDVEVFQGEDQLEVELSGADQELLVRGEGRLLLSFQHLLPRLMQSTLGEMTPCRVDSCGFRDRRVASLRKLARKTADEVRRRQRPRTLRSMSPADRRTVHLALKDDEAVRTESAGDGFYKRITVRPN